MPPATAARDSVAMSRLVLEAGLAKMHLVVDHPRQEPGPGEVDLGVPGAGRHRSAHGVDAPGRNAYIAFDRAALVDDGGVPERDCHARCPFPLACLAESNRKLVVAPPKRVLCRRIETTHAWRLLAPDLRPSGRETCSPTRHACQPSLRVSATRTVAFGQRLLAPAQAVLPPRRTSAGSRPPKSDRLLVCFFCAALVWSRSRVR